MPRAVATVAILWRAAPL